MAHDQHYGLIVPCRQPQRLRWGDGRGIACAFAGGLGRRRLGLVVALAASRQHRHGRGRRFGLAVARTTAGRANPASQLRQSGADAHSSAGQPRAAILG